MRISKRFMLAALVVVYGCNPIEEKGLEGSWYNIKEHLVMRFDSDGSVNFDDVDSDLTGRYSVPAANHLRIETSGKVDVVQFSLEEDVLVLSRDGKPDFRFVRLSPGAVHPNRTERSLSTTSQQLSDNNKIDLEDAAAVRDRIITGLIISAGCQAAISEYWLDFDSYPASLEAAGCPFQPNPAYSFIETLELVNGNIIRIIFRADEMELPESIQNISIRMKHELSRYGDYKWSCEAEFPLSAHREFLPAHCR